MNEERLPKCWEIKAVGDVCEITYGDGLPKRDRNGGDVPVYGSGGVNGYHDEALYEQPAVILGRKGSIDKVWFVTEPFWAIDTTFYTDVYENEAIPRYLYYFFEYLDLERYDTSSAVPSLRKGDLQEISIPIPPISEQKRIVQKLDYLFSLVKESSDEIERANTICEQLESTIFLSGVKSSNATKVNSGDVIEDSQYGISEAMNEDGQGYPILRMGNYDEKGSMDYSDLKHIELTDSEFEKYSLREGDVLFNRTNSKELVGKTAIYDGGLENAVFASYLIRIYLDKERILPEFYVRYMNSTLGRSEINEKSKQAVSQANINTGEINSMSILLPSIEKQQKIISKIHSLESTIRKIDVDIKTSRKILDRFPKSLLKDAFNGEMSYSIPSTVEEDINSSGQASLGEF
ncbi:restriction endonuclease subunit S [Halorarum halophilum]|uniref:Restriction endonuclease subunit S n=1 Tax=Halorarum halophilum TaxID=2743090 RepID=A0A7D5K8C4_9EURY|nr:restriction endonuclease subunit S [Halobaculum halophilum]QLG28159.1 restriction endonuclease subunit S [Halobaculum halophilum]